MCYNPAVRTISYVIPMRCVGKERPKSAEVGKGEKRRTMHYMPPEYVKAVKEFRSHLRKLGLPEKPIPRIAAGKKSKPVRNIRMDVRVSLIGFSAVDKDNAEGFVADAMQQRKIKGLVVWQGVFENDWQIWDGRTQVLMYQPVNQIEVTLYITTEPTPETFQGSLFEV